MKRTRADWLMGWMAMWVWAVVLALPLAVMAQVAEGEGAGAETSVEAGPQTESAASEGAAVSERAEARSESQVEVESEVTPLAWQPHEAVEAGFADFWPTAPPLVVTVVSLGALLLAALLAHVIVRRVVLVVIHRVALRSRTSWDETMEEAGVFQRLAPVLPLAIIHWGILLVPHLSASLAVAVQRVALATIVLMVVRSLGAVLTAVNVIYQRYPMSRGHPIKGYLQVVKVVVYVFAGILMFAILMDQSPWFFLSGMGAMMAIIMLVFRDTLLSFVAGIQLVNNGLIHVGDWIEMPQFDADGDVTDIALNVVTVQNWDKTVTVIPTHKFLEHSFRNWRSMHEAGGRRIKRSIAIDVRSIRFLSEEEIERFGRFLLLKDYIAEKVEELAAYNAEHCPPGASDVVTNARRLTNVGTFRAYVQRYLRQHGQIHENLTFLIRHLQPTSQGLPLEIYVFTKDTRWPVYEAIQADIFDHLLAVLPEFGLRVFQEPTGHDVTMLGRSSVEDSGGGGNGHGQAQWLRE